MGVCVGVGMRERYRGERMSERDGVRDKERKIESERGKERE